MRLPPVVGPSSQLLVAAVVAVAAAAAAFSVAPASVLTGWLSAESRHCEQVVCVPEAMSEFH